MAAETTERYLVLLPDQDDRERGVRALETHFADAPAVVFDAIGVAVVTAPLDRFRALSVATEPGAGDVLAIEPERVVYAIERPPATVDESRFTWGLQATGVPSSRFTGAGIKVAVLDTGFDLGHPDFAGRTVVTESHVAGVPVQDVAGHGTHCIGTACGPRDPAVPPRYGIAYGADIYAGKVLNDDGRGVDGDLLAGIEWAIVNECEVISMSLGAPGAPGQPFSAVFERAASRALARGSLIVAAEGNDSRRDQGQIAPVSHPANCPSIMATAAVDSSLQVASFSNGAAAAAGGEVDFAGPGVDVRSAWPMPTEYNTLSGTSMATPHVAGIAALTAEADPTSRGDALRTALQRRARRLPLPSTDVGAGLVQAP